VKEYYLVLKLERVCELTRVPMQPPTNSSYARTSTRSSTQATCSRLENPRPMRCLLHWRRSRAARRASTRKSSFRCADHSRFSFAQLAGCSYHILTQCQAANQHEELFRQVHTIKDLEGGLSQVTAGVDSLQNAITSIRAELSEPFELIQARTIQLERVQVG